MTAADPDRERDAVHAFSKAVLGNQHRLEVLAAISRAPDRFYQREIAESAAVPDPTVAPILTQLEGIRLIQSIERLRGNGPRFYERQPHAVWRLAEELLDAARSSARAASRKR